MLLLMFNIMELSKEHNLYINKILTNPDLKKMVKTEGTVGQYELDIIKDICTQLEKKEMKINIIKLEKMFSKKWEKPIKGSKDLFKVLIRQLRRCMNDKFGEKIDFRKLNGRRYKKYFDAVNRFSDKMLKKITVNYERIKGEVIKKKLGKSKGPEKKGRKKKIYEEEEGPNLGKDLENKKHMPIRISDLEENLQHLFAYYLGFESVDELYQNQPNIFFKKIGIVNLPA